MWKVLRERDFALLTVGQAMSAFGDWLILIALPFFVYDVTRSAAYTGLAFVAETVPRLLLGPLGGVLADRWDRRRTMITMDLARAVTIAGLLLADSRRTVWIALAVAFMESVFSQLFLPARAAVVPYLVTAEQLGPANQVASTIDSVIRVVGAGFGGALFAWFGLHWLAGVDAATYVVSAVTLAFITVPTVPRARAGMQPSEPEPEPEPDLVPAPGTVPPPLEETQAIAPEPSVAAGLWADFVDGLRTVRGNGLVLGIFAVFGLAMLAQGVVNVLIVPFVDKVLDTGSGEYGLLLAGQGIGALIGSLGLGMVSRRLPPVRVMALGMTVAGGAFLAFVNSNEFVVPMALMVVVGTAVIAVLITAQTLLQLAVPPTHLGRVFGAFSTVATVLLLLGMAFAATLGDRIGIRPSLDVAAALFFASGLVALRLPAPDMPPAPQPEVAPETA